MTHPNSIEANSSQTVGQESGLKPGLRLGLVLWLAGFIGVLSLLPLLPQIVAQLADSAPPVSMAVVRMVSTLQTGLLLLLAVWLGVRFAGKCGLSAPIFSRLAGLPHPPINYRSIVYTGAAGGVASGLFLAGFTQAFQPYLPADFLANAEQFQIPLYAKLLYGGITEEILLRWGLMSALTWLIASVTNRGAKQISGWVFIAAIFITSVLFGAGHLPLANVLAETVTPSMMVYIFVANGFVGLIAGYAFWKKGLESAIIIHMVAHVVWFIAG